MSVDKRASDNVNSLLEPLFTERVDRFTLGNGLTVVHKEDPCGLVSIQVWVKTGSIHEEPLLGSGISHYLEHMLFKGTDRRTAQQLTAEVQAIGGGINAYTTFDRTVYYVDAPSEAAPQVLDILHDMVFHSRLDNAEVERERDVILREIDMTLDDPDRQVGQELFENAFRAHPYRLPVIGHRELFEQVSREDLWNYYQNRYVPQNMVLVVVGDIGLQELETHLQGTFAKPPRRLMSEPVVAAEPAQLAPRRVRLTGDVSICRGAIGFRIPSLRHDDAPGLNILATVLGGGESSLLSLKLRTERKLVHEIDTSCWNPGEQGLFWVTYVCDPGREEEVEAAIVEEIKNAAAQGFSQEDVEKAQRQAMVSEINSRKTVGGQAGRLGMAEVVGGDLAYPRYYFGKLETVTPQLLPELAQKYLVAQNMTSVALDAPRHSATAASRKQRKTLPDFESLTLCNGARILFQRDSRLPKVHMRYCALGGPLYEKAANRGITHLLANLLTKDTHYRSATEVARAVESAGGSFDHFCGNNAFGVSLELLSRDFDLGQQVMEEALLMPSFNEKTFEIERAAQLAELKEEQDEITDRGRTALRKAFFGRHPYAVAANGTPDAVAALEREQMGIHYQQLVVARNSVFVVSGDFDPDYAIPRLQLMLERLPDYQFKQALPNFKGPNAADIVEHMDREQAVVYQSYQGPGILQPHYHAAELLDEVFSDMSGRLFTRVREEKGLAYFVGASRMVGLNCGMFTLYGGTHPSSANEMRREFEAAVENVRRNGISPEELKRCQTRLKAQKRSGMQSLSARAASAGLDALYGLPLNYSKSYDERIDAVTSEHIQEFAREHLWEGDRVTLIIGPQEAEAVLAG